MVSVLSEWTLKRKGKIACHSEFTGQEVSKGWQLPISGMTWLESKRLINPS
jgi:hypothetical protein